MPDNVIPLNPDQDQVANAAQERLRSVVYDEIAPTGITQAALIGCIEMLKLELMFQMYEDIE